MSTCNKNHNPNSLILDTEAPPNIYAGRWRFKTIPLLHVTQNNLLVDQNCIDIVM